MLYAWSVVCECWLCLFPLFVISFELVWKTITSWSPIVIPGSTFLSSKLYFFSSRAAEFPRVFFLVVVDFKNTIRTPIKLGPRNILALIDFLTLPDNKIAIGIKYQTTHLHMILSLTLRFKLYANWYWPKSVVSLFMSALQVLPLNIFYGLPV